MQEYVGRFLSAWQGRMKTDFFQKKKKSIKFFVVVLFFDEKLFGPLICFDSEAMHKIMCKTGAS